MAEFGKEAVALIHVSLETSCLWQLFLLKVKIPFVCGKNLIKTKKQKNNNTKNKAQPKSTLVSIYNLGEGISRRFNSYMKKNLLLRSGCVSHFLLALSF